MIVDIFIYSNKNNKYILITDYQHFILMNFLS